jgi:hypothetical protein
MHTQLAVPGESVIYYYIMLMCIIEPTMRVEYAGILLELGPGRPDKLPIAEKPFEQW